MRGLWLHVRRSPAGPTVVLDVDGVLVDSRLRELVAVEASRGERSRFWAVFLSASLTHLDAPGPGLAFYAWARARGYNVAVVSGRPRRLAWDTLLQLNSLGVDPDVFVAREEGVYAKAQRLKLEALRVLEAMGARVALLVDDSPEVVEAARRLGYPAVTPLIALHWAARGGGGERRVPGPSVLEHATA